VASTVCSGGACGIGSCNANFFNFDGSYGNGCECGETSFGKTCGGATSLGTIGVGGGTSRTGNIPSAGGENWFVVTFAYTSASSYNPRMSLTGSGGTFLFDVYSNCSFNPLGCGSGGQSTSLNMWSVHGGGDVGTQTWSPTPSVGTVYVRVRRTSAASCASYTLTVNN
jgi:hypothetical protein